MRGLKVNTEPKVMKAPVAIGESVKIPLSPKVANTVKAIEKVTDTQLALLLLRQVNNNSFTYTMRHHTHTQKTKDTVTGLTRCTHWSFTVAVWLSLIENFYVHDAAQKQMT